MPLDSNNPGDALLLRRVANLEERVRDILTAQTQFVTATQVQELLAVISTELAALNDTIKSLERRVSILEDIPNIN
jgi:hypothetical protein